MNMRFCRSITGELAGLVSLGDETKKLSSVFDVARAPDRLSRTDTSLLNNYAVEITLGVLISS